MFGLFANLVPAKNSREISRIQMRRVLVRLMNGG
jgi:hypothetical protein